MQSAQEQEHPWSAGIGRPRKQMLTQQQRNNRRRRANPRQLAFLRKKFSEDPKPDQAAREKIGRAIDMTPRSVQIWFQNNRAKTKDQERKFSMHGKLFTMTTRACSENVSCVQAGGGDPAAYAGYGGRTYGGGSAGPYRFYTPPPSRARYGRSSNWWDADLSHPDLTYGLAQSQEKEILPRESLDDLFARPRSHSTMNVSYSRVPYPTPRDSAFSFMPNSQATKGQRMYLPESDGHAESLASLDAESPISTIESPGSEGYDLSADLAGSMSDLQSVDASLSYDIDFNQDDSADPFGSTQPRIFASPDFTADPAMASVPTQDTQAFAKDYEPADNGEDLDALVHALDLRASSGSHTGADDFTRIPCSLVRIGQYLAEDGDNTGQTLLVHYSPTEQVLQITLTDSMNGRATIMEKDVLHFPPSRNLQNTSFGCSQIDVEVFGAPRIRIEDLSGRRLPPSDPTSGEIFSAHQCRLFGDYDEQLATVQKLENAEAGISGSWLTATGDVSPTSIEPRVIDPGLLTDGAITALAPRELEANYESMQPAVADHFYR